MDNNSWRCVHRSCVDGASAPPRHHRRATVAVVHHAIAAAPARPRRSEKGTPSTRRATATRCGVLRGSDRFCRQAWIRFFSMNRHQRTVWREKEDAAARGYWGGCWTKTGPAWWWTMYHRPSLLSNTLMASSADGSPSGASLHVTQAAEPRRTCVEIKVLRLVPRHRRDACSMAWRCRFLAARPSQDGRVIAEK